MQKASVWCLIAAMTALLGCGDGEGAQQRAGDNLGGKQDSGQGAASLCVGVRGNGARIFAHFGAMARIHEERGLIQGVAGGSSGSITSFLTESMYTNPHAFRCGQRACTPQESSLRIALLFKSTQGYLGVLSRTDEALALGQLAPLLGRLKESGVDALLADGQIEAARGALLDLLGSEDLRALINPELLELLASSPDPEHHVRDLWAALSSFGSFSTDSDLIFVRPGLLSFEALAARIGRMGSFYAAYGPADGAAWEDLLSACAPAARGRSWAEIAALDPGDGVTCGARFDTLLTTWRQELLKDEASHHSRIDDPIGEVLPSLISTSVLTGDAAERFRQARAAYLQGEPAALDPDFDDVRFGYWGQDADLERVAANKNDYKDLKTMKFLSLGEATWRTALSLSPAEPGLTRALEIDGALVSAGGWSDLAPTLVLKNLGCEEVILVTRQGQVQGGFGPSVAALLGMSAQEDAALYDLDGDSAVHRSLAEADGVWCTNWDGFRETQFQEIFADAYDAPLSSQGITGLSAYEHLTKDLSQPGCSPGVE